MELYGFGAFHLETAEERVTEGQWDQADLELNLHMFVHHRERSCLKLNRVVQMLSTDHDRCVQCIQLCGVNIELQVIQLT